MLKLNYIVEINVSNLAATKSRHLTCRVGSNYDIICVLKKNQANQ